MGVKNRSCGGDASCCGSSFVACCVTARATNAIALGAVGGMINGLVASTH